MKRAHIKKINSIFFLFCIFAFGVMSFKAVTLPHSSIKRFLSGDTFRQIEDLYQERFPGKNIATGMWAAIQYQLFKEGMPGVIVGIDDWLFSSEEYNLPHGHEKQLQTNLSKILQIKSQLEDRKINLVIALVPEKTDIYRQYLIKQSPHNELDLYGQTLKFLKRNNVEAIDLRYSMKQSINKGVQVFLKTDTHWTVYGAEVSAKSIAFSNLLAKGTDKFVVTNSNEIKQIGDLQNFIPTGEIFYRFGPPNNTIRSIDFDKISEQNALFNDVELDTALIGTSYSADERWKFLEWLQLYLQKEIVNYSHKGYGPFFPMKKFLNDGFNEVSDIKQIIWEIPVRYLLTNEKRG